MVGLNIEWGCQMPPDIAASDIAVLKAELSAQSKAINDLTKNTERLLELTTSIARMQERMEQHADGLDRAFNLIEKLDLRSEEGDKQLRREIDGVAEDLETATKAGSDDCAHLRAELSHWVNFGKGAWAAASILWLLIAWLLIRQIDTMEGGIGAAATANAALERRVTTLEHRTSTPAVVAPPVAKQTPEGGAQ